MTQFNELLQKIELAASLGNEPTLEELAIHNINSTEYNELITLNSMIKNDIELIRTYNNVEITPNELLIHNYQNHYYPLLEKFDLVEFLPRIDN